MEEITPAVPYRCQSCGMESTVKQAFVEKRNLLGQVKKTFCFECMSKRQARFLLFELVGLALLGGLYYLVNPHGFTSTFILYAFGCFLVNIPIVLVHELSHAAVGTLLGLRVFMIHLGYGRLLLNFKFLGVRWVARLVPLGGATILAGPELPFYRLRYFLAVLAGPVSHLVMAVLLSLFQVLMVLKTGTVHWIIGAAIWMNIISLVINLIPHKVSTTFGMTGTDGMKLIHILRMQPKELAAGYVLYHSQSAVDAVERKDLPDALKRVQDGLALYPDNPILINALGYVYSHMEEHAQARQAFMRVLESQEEMPEAMKYLVRNNIAFADVMLEDPALLQEANEYSQLAYQNMKWEPILAGTRGAVLCALGRYEEGIELLKISLAKSLDRNGRASDACFIARAEARRGDLAEAKKYLEMARRLAPDNALLKKVGQELGSAAGD